MRISDWSSDVCSSDLLVALAVVGRPVPGEERQRVQVARRVDAGTGVAVLQPGAADVVVLVDDRVADARLVEADGEGEPRDARPHDEDVGDRKSTRLNSSH